MSKFVKIDPSVLRDAAAAVGVCWNEGSPVASASPEQWNKIAHVAFKRIRSFDRRGVAAHDRAAQVHDVAKGLMEQFEADPNLVGPLIIDYERVAERVLDVVGLGVE